MDPSAQYQQQNLAPQAYAPSQVEAQDQQTQAYYQFHNQYNQAQQYPYYPPHYTNAYPQNQQHEQEPIPIHPPGVPIPHDPTLAVGFEQGFGQTYVQNQQNSYYPQGIVETQQQQQQLQYSDPGVQGQQWQGNNSEVGVISLYPQGGQSQYSGAGRTGGRPLRGGRAPFRGRGRGRGRGGNPSFGQAAPVRPPPRMAWCELCRVDCNTPEILENHKNGKKHKKNLKVYEELQALAQKRQEEQVANTDFKPEADPPLENSSSQAVTEENKVAETGQGRGSKRKTRGGRGGKWLRTNDGSRKPIEPPKPKEIVPFICELCNVKCESPPVFDSHLKGKKHIFNLQRFQEHQATLGQAALQALYPALQSLYPALLQALCQPNANANANASTSSATLLTELDQQVLHWLQAFLPQTGPSGLSGLPQGPALAPPSALEAQDQQDVTIQGSSSGGGTREGLPEGAENQVVPESKIEELDSKSAEPTE